MKFYLTKATSYIELPEFIKNNKACVNVQNLNNRCFQYSILAKLHRKEQNACKPHQYDEYFNELNMGDLKTPMSIEDIKKFEKLNPSISVNVYMQQKRRGIFYIYPVRLTNEEKVHHVNLLLIESYYEDDNEDDYDMATNYKDDAAAAVNADNATTVNNASNYYVLIRSMTRLCRAQLTGCRNDIHICNRCLVYFTKKCLLKKHRKKCRTFNDCYAARVPIQGETLKVSDYRFKPKLPFVIYADFEIILSPNENDDENNYERITHYHHAFSIGFYLKCSFDDSKSYYKSYRQSSENDMTPAIWFVKELAIVTADLEASIKNIEPMNLTKTDIEAFGKADRCHICNGLFRINDENKKPVKDHCHFSGIFKGATHNSCNLNYTDSRKIPVFSQFEQL
ncbi:hypothetical protein TKK_0007812 [Trichogramma kaykai]